ncbi:hypothetical protein C0995_009617 [Termitomyces sp. Mi166|nr:hypothetical protein C0995_009617 [Termitomyces sp. Mi166\
MFRYGEQRIFMQFPSKFAPDIAKVRPICNHEDPAGLTLQPLTTLIHPSITFSKASMKYSTVVVVACIGGASLATAAEAGTHPHPHPHSHSHPPPHPHTPKIGKPSLLSNAKQAGHNGKQFLKTAVEAGGGGQQVAQNAGVLVHAVNTWSKTTPTSEALSDTPLSSNTLSDTLPSSTEEPVVARQVDEPRRPREGRRKGPKRLPRQDDAAAPAQGHKVESLMTQSTKSTPEGTTLVKTGPGTTIGGPLPHSSLPPPVRRDVGDELNMEVRDLGTEDLEVRTFGDDKSLYGRNFLDIREELAARGYNDAELEARFLSGLKNRIKKIFSGKKSASSADPSMTTDMPVETGPQAHANEDAPIAARDIVDQEHIESRDFWEDYLDSRDLSDMALLERDIREELAARGYDDVDLEARGLFDSLKKLFFGTKVAPSVQPPTVTDPYAPSMVTHPYPNEYAPPASRDIVEQEYLESRDLEEDYLKSRDLSEMELFERDIREALVARGLFDGLKRLFFGTKVVTPSVQVYPPASVVVDAYANKNVPIARRSFVDEEYLNSRDFEEDYLESRDFDDEMELFRRDFAEELDARDSESELDVRDLEIDELD